MENKKLKLEELNRPSVQDFQKMDKIPVVVVLDNVRSALNVGSVFRTCDAFAIEKLILVGITPTPPQREVLKTALGATASVNWEYIENTDTLIKTLEEQRIPLISIEQTEKSEMLQNVVWPSSFAIVLGNEVNGVESKLIDFSVKCVEIPQFGTKHSFNIAVTAGIVLWEASKFVRPC